jgi:hypothetical protein
MNPAEELFQKQREIGPAIWLLTLYWFMQPSDEGSWAWVRAGSPMFDEEVAARLKVSVYTAARWRDRLRRAGMIQAIPRERGFSVFAYRPPFASKVLEYFDGPTSGGSTWPRIPTSMVQ